MKQIRLYLALILIIILVGKTNAQFISNNACNAYCLTASNPIATGKTPINSGGTGITPCGGDIIEFNPIWWSFRPSGNEVDFTLNVSNCKNVPNNNLISKLTIYVPFSDCKGPINTSSCIGGVGEGVFKIKSQPIKPYQRYYLQLINSNAGTQCDFTISANAAQLIKDSLDVNVRALKKRFCVGEVVSFKAAISNFYTPIIWKWEVEPQGYTNVILSNTNDVLESTAVIEFLKLPPKGTKLCVKATPVFNTTTQNAACTPYITSHCFEPEVIQLENETCNLTLKETDLPYTYEIKNCLNQLDSIYKDSIVQNKTIIIDKNDFPVGKITSKEYAYQINGFNCLAKLNLKVKVQPTNTLEFGIDNNVCGIKGQILSVPVRVKNFKKIADFQMSVTVKDTSVASIIGFEPGLLNVNTSVINAGVGNILWYDPDVTGVDLADSAVIYYVKIKLNGAFNKSATIEFDDSYLQMKAEAIIADNFVELFPIPKNGSVCILKSIDVCGKIKREDNQPIANVEVRLQNATGIIKTTITDKQGNYCFKDIVTNNDSILIIRPRKIDTPKNGVTSGDMFRIQKHILGTELLGSAYKRLAADVDNTKTIGSPDVARIQQLILNKIKNFDGVDAWGFTPSTFNLGVDPFDKVIPKSINVNTAQSTLDADFIGYKMADVNNSNIPNSNPVANTRTTEDVFLNLVANLTNNKSELLLNVTAKAFRDMVAAQFSINWDSKTLKFQGLSNYNSLLSLNDANFNISEQSEGKLGFLWFSQTGQSITLPEEAILFTLKFRVLENFNNISVEFTNTPITINSENSEQEINTKLQNCTIDSKAVLTTLEEKYNNSLFNIYPNPVADVLHIEISTVILDKLKIELIDIDGKVVRFLEGNFNNRLATLELNNLPSQTYIIKISSNEDILFSQKILKK